MGCFDSVLFKCECGEKLEVQSKAHICDLKEYNLGGVPLSIAGDLDGEVVECPKCGAEYSLRAQSTAVCMNAVKLETCKTCIYNRKISVQFTHNRLTMTTIAAIGRRNNGFTHCS